MGSRAVESLAVCGGRWPEMEELVNIIRSKASGFKNQLFPRTSLPFFQKENSTKMAGDGRIERKKEKL